VSRHRYPAASLAADYARGGVGLLLTAGPLAALPVHWAIAWFLGGAAVLFAAFLGRTGLRHATVIETDERGIAAHGPLPKAIPWESLTDLRLRFYSTRRDREQGWMQLNLRGRGRRLAVESSIDEFDEIARRAAAEAQRNGVELPEATVNNLMAIGALPARSGLAERWGLTPDGRPQPDDLLEERAGQPRPPSRPRPEPRKDGA
jgi:hypothetical protein